LASVQWEANCYTGLPKCWVRACSTIDTFLILTLLCAIWLWGQGLADCDYVLSVACVVLFPASFLHARLMIATICVAGKFTMGKYGWIFAQVPDVPALVCPKTGLHSVTLQGTRYTSTVVAKHETPQHRCDKQSLFLHQNNVLLLLLPWAARYNTCLLIKLAPKGIVFSFLFLLLLTWDVADLWRRLGQAQYRNWRLLQMQHQSTATRCQLSRWWLIVQSASGRGRAVGSAVWEGHKCRG